MNVGSIYQKIDEPHIYAKLVHVSETDLLTLAVVVTDHNQMPFTKYRHEMAAYRLWGWRIVKDQSVRRLINMALL